MDLSDDIAYSVHDFEDAIVSGYLDVPALGARVNHDELVDAMFEWIGGEISHDELIAAFDWKPGQPPPSLPANWHPPKPPPVWGPPLIVAAYGTPSVRDKLRAALGHPSEPDALLFTA